MKTLLLLILFSLAGLGAGLALHTWKSLDAPSMNSAPVSIDIPRGYGPDRIGRLLADSGLVRSPRHFSWYCRWTGRVSQLKAGSYAIPPGTTIPEMVDILSTGNIADRRVTIPEGRASWEILRILQKHYPKFDSARWEALVQDKAFATELGIPSPTLEGWLFPDTYSFPLEADEKAIATLLVRHAQNTIQALEPRATTALQKLGGWHGILTMASIVEEETGNPTERPHIAGVFLNRLRIGMPLGADPTVRFIYRDLTGELWKVQLNSNNPYNTRKFAGLPPGPISNPGRAAIEAVLAPMETKDLYFVAKDDGSAEHFFAPTLIQHNVWKAAAARNRKALSRSSGR